MLQAPVVSPSNLYALRLNRKSSERASHSDMADYEEDDDDEYGDDAGEESKGRNKSRRELPAGAVATLKAWLLSPEHFTHPYPTPQDQTMLMQKTGIDKKQLKNWFTNARRRIWKPMLKKQIEQGKLQTTAGISMPGLFQGMPGGGTMAATNSMENPHSVQAMRVHYQQAVQQQDQGQQVRCCCYDNDVSIVLKSLTHWSATPKLNSPQIFTGIIRTLPLPQTNCRAKISTMYRDRTRPCNWPTARPLGRYRNFHRATNSARRIVTLF